jgi:hypothetical protein
VTGGDEREQALRAAADRAVEWLNGLSERPVGPVADASVVRDRLGGPLPESGTDPVRVVEELAEAVEPGLVASAGPRYFGFVIGALPAAAAERSRRSCTPSSPDG